MDYLAQLAATAPIAFLFGVFVGFLLANRYRLSKRNGDKEVL